MGLGRREGRHQTAAASRVAGVDPSANWDFQPGQHVMTIDGFAGRVTAVNDGPQWGLEEYEVTLDGGMGGGRYAASQLSLPEQTTASVEHTAADDYPELGDILLTRPDIARNTVLSHYDPMGSHAHPCNLCFSHDHNSQQHERMFAPGQQGAVMVGQAVDDAIGTPQQAHFLDTNPINPSKYSLLVTASDDSDFRFHFTATWRDVQAKAKRIRSDGGVHVTLSTEGMVVAEVQGDTNVYEAGLQRLPGREAIAAWSCGCKWGAYHWGADDDFSRFAGRMCSHALALQYEAQARGMFGRPVTEDEHKPKWVPRRVVVKYDIDADRNVKAPATPARGDFGRAASLRQDDGTSAMEALAVAAMAEGWDPGDFELALVMAGVTGAVNDAWGEPEPDPLPKQQGPTSMPKKGEDPGSAGPLSSPDPENWGSIEPSNVSMTAVAEGHCPMCNGTDTHSGKCGDCGEDLQHGFAPSHCPSCSARLGEEWNGEGCYSCGHGMPADEDDPNSDKYRDAEKAVHDAFGGEDHSWLLDQNHQGPSKYSALDEFLFEADLDTADDSGAEATLHDEPEAALPSTDGSEGPENDDWINRAYQQGAQVGENKRPGAQASAVSPSQLEDTVDQQDDALSPEDSDMQSVGSLEEIVASFQKNAGHLQGAGGGGDNDIAAAARMFLETGQHPPAEGRIATEHFASKTFTPSEQQAIIGEGENVRAANLDSLDIAGTHYEPLEAALAAYEAEHDDENWLDS